MAIDRRSASVARTIAELNRIRPALGEGAALRAKDVGFRRAAIDVQARSSVLLDARATVSGFATSVGAEPMGPEEGFETTVARLELLLQQRAEQLNTRLSLRRRGLELVESLKTSISRKAETERLLEADTEALNRVTAALKNAQALRTKARLCGKLLTAFALK